MSYDAAGADAWQGRCRTGCLAKNTGLMNNIAPQLSGNYCRIR
jgi:hypothetical protein